MAHLVEAGLLSQHVETSGAVTVNIVCTQPQQNAREHSRITINKHGVVGVDGTREHTAELTATSTAYIDNNVTIHWLIVERTIFSETSYNI